MIEKISNSVYNDAVSVNLKMLSKDLQRQEKTLKSLQRTNANETVIDAQKQVVESLQKQYDNSVAAEELAKECIGDSPITFQVVNEETGKTEEVKKKIAFVKNNRPINNVKVDKFISIIAKNKYEKAYPIIVVEAKQLIGLGYKVHDLKGREISLEKADGYFVILDGQHRGKAFAILIATGENYEIPNVRIREKENIGEYLVDINDAGTSWDNKDRLAVAALTATGEKELFTEIAELIDDGFNPSTSAIIFTGKKFSKGLINKVLKREKFSLPKDAKVDIERGRRFVTLCKAAGIKTKYLTKHYLIDGFNSYAASTSEEQAFKALESLKNLNLTDERMDKIKDGTHFIKLLKEALSD